MTEDLLAKFKRPMEMSSANFLAWSASELTFYSKRTTWLTKDCLNPYIAFVAKFVDSTLVIDICIESFKQTTIFLKEKFIQTGSTYVSVPSSLNSSTASSLVVVLNLNGNNITTISITISETSLGTAYIVYSGGPGELTSGYVYPNDPGYQLLFEYSQPTQQNTSTGTTAGTTSSKVVTSATSSSKKIILIIIIIIIIIITVVVLLVIIIIVVFVILRRRS